MARGLRRAAYSSVESHVFRNASDRLENRLLFERLKIAGPAQTDIVQSRQEPAMSSRHDKDHLFETGSPEIGTSDWNRPSAGADAGTMHELQRASEMVLQLATQTHAAVARSDMAGAQVARASLEKQLTQTTRMIDELLFGASGQPTMH
jgi:hypothetical protein